MGKVKLRKKLSGINEYDYEGERLIFAETTDGTYTIENKEYENLGRIEKIRVGAWMHWCLFLEPDCYLSPGCNDEVREMQRMLGSPKTSKEKSK